MCCNSELDKTYELSLVEAAQWAACHYQLVLHEHEHEQCDSLELVPMMIREA